MVAFKENLTCRNFVNVFIRLPLATFLVHHFSHWLFDNSRAQHLIQIFASKPFFQFPGRAANDLKTLQKMLRFWPPHQGQFGEFSLVFTISMILFIRLIDMPTVLRSVFGLQKSWKVLNWLITPIYSSLIVFILLLPMMRLAEMHIFVLALNFVHILGVAFIVYTSWYFLKGEQVLEVEAKEEKKKTE